MAVSRAKKEALLEGYTESMTQAPHLFLVGYKGISVNQATELRRRIRETGGQYVVVKNSVVLRAAEGKALEQLKEHFSGPVAVAFSHEDPVAIAKVLTEFAKEAPFLEFKAGLVEGRPIAANEVEGIASLPSREELIAKLLFLMQSPISRFVKVLAAAGPRRLATVLDQISKQKS